jgi:hypothetical protein
MLAGFPRYHHREAGRVPSGLRVRGCGRRASARLEILAVGGGECVSHFGDLLVVAALEFAPLGGRELRAVLGARV